jgi:aminodeoxyfutalosine synthase
VSAVSEAEVSALAERRDILTLGILADEVRRARHGARTTFVRVADLSSEPGASVVWPPSAGEIRIVGAPGSLAAALSRVREIASGVGEIPLSGFSLADLEQLALSERIPLRTFLEQLRGEGLELVAEAPVDRLQDARRSIEEVNIAGLALARLTVHQWPAPAGDGRSSEISEFFRGIDALQRQVAVIRTFAPLPRRVNPAAPSTGYEDITRVALARLLVDSIPSIQVDWALYGPKLAQVALTVGADDVDGVSAEDDLSQGVRRSPVEEIRRNIRAAGLDAIERGGRFDPIPARA